MAKQTKIIIASLAALLVIVLAVLCYFVFFGARVKCNFCEEMYFEKQGKVAPLFGMMCPDCYEEFLVEFGGDDDDDDDDEDNDNNSSTHVHTEVIDAEVAATCTSTGLTEGKHCSECGKIIIGQNVIPVKAHTYDNNDDTTCNVCGFDKIRDCKHEDAQQIITVSAKEANCIETGLTEGKKCNICGTMVVQQVVIPIDSNNHTTIVCEAVDPTCQKTGLTEGVKCILCNEMIVEQVIIPIVDCENFESLEIEDVKPSKTQDGKYHTECEICGRILNEYIYGAGSQGLEYTWNGDGYTVTGMGSCSDTDIVIPEIYRNEPVTSIGEEAFEWCESISSVSLPNTIVTIGDFAFASCTSLESITIPDSVTSLGGGAFFNCTSLTDVTLGCGITALRDIDVYGLFSECHSLTRITIPVSVKLIDYWTFYNAKLTDVYYLGTMEQWNAINKEDSLCNTYYTVHCSNGNITE